MAERVKKIAKLEVIKAGSNPDVDTDFRTDIREKVIEHVAEEYGKDKVSYIITFGSMAAKGAFKAMCTIYEIPFAQANKIASLVPGPIEGNDCTLEDIFNPESERYSEGADFRAAVEGEYWKEIIEGARAIEGRYKSTGRHACGVIISSENISNHMPLMFNQKENKVLTQWTYPDCEDIGFIKFDFLGLDTVDLLQYTVEYIKKNGKTPPNMFEINQGPMDDKKTYELLSSGQTLGVFQLGSDIVRDFIKFMKPDEFNDIAACTALMRPGPMGMQSHSQYASRKNGLSKIESIHPDFAATGTLDEILAETYGLVVYQESVMQIANRIAGMTLQEGDELRKAMGKKKIKTMEAMKPKFMEGGKANGYGDEALNKLWDTIAEFAKYGFNKCLHGRTKVSLSNNEGKITIEELYERFLNGEENLEIMSMHEDGEIRPHRIKEVVKSGLKPLYTIKTKSGRSIRVTGEHRLLTVDGYKTIDDGGVRVGVELINDPLWSKRLSDETLSTRRSTMAKVNGSPSMRFNASRRMKNYQAQLTKEDRVRHQRKIQEANPARTDNWLLAGQEAYKNAKKLGKVNGKGIVTELTDGRECDSICEALAAEYLISRGIDFELHKPLISVNGKRKYCDFYAEGLYFEMDGLGRGRDYFVENKYGEDIPFVYMTPLNYKDVIDEAIITHHIANGDEIIEIVSPKVLRGGGALREMTYDIEMEDDGPSNFIANGIVSHNSHSIAYAMAAYSAAYLKANYPVEFMAALIAQNTDDRDKTLTFLQESSRMGIKIGSIDVNVSDIRVAPDYNKISDFDIVYGLSGVKAVSAHNAEIIVGEREANGVYVSVQDFVDRLVPLGITNKKIYENIALGGGFDGFGVTRKSVVENISAMITDTKTTTSMGASLFDMFDEAEVMSELELSRDDEFPHIQKLQYEADVIGLYLTGHPVDNMGSGLGGNRTIKIKDLLKYEHSSTVNVVGSITEIEKKIMKRGGKSIKITIDDGTGYIEGNLNQALVKGIDKYSSQERAKNLYLGGEKLLSDELLKIVTNKDYDAIPDIEKNNVYMINMTFRPGNEDMSPAGRINSIKRLELSDGGVLPVRLRVGIKHSKNIDAVKAKLDTFAKAVAKKYPGEYPLYVGLFTEDDRIKVLDDGEYYLKLSEMMASGGKIIIGDEIVKSSNNSMFGNDKSATVKSKKSNDNAKILPFYDKSSFPHVMYSEGELADNLTYYDTGVKVAKNNQVEELLVSKFGAERVDFGVFDESLNESE